jgi:hypothetical protein
MPSGALPRPHLGVLSRQKCSGQQHFGKMTVNVYVILSRSAAEAKNLVVCIEKRLFA